MSDGRVQFCRLDEFPPKTVYGILRRSYEEYLSQEPSRRTAWYADWQEYDSEIQNRPEIADSGFFTCLDGEPIGMASWFPMEKGIRAGIGHNCIVPEFRGKGYGTEQIKEAIRVLRSRGFMTVEVTTGENAFFAGARRMYEICGFEEVDRQTSYDYPDFRTIHYRLELR